MLLIAAVILLLVWAGGLALHAGEFIHALAVIAMVLIGMHFLGTFAPPVI